MAEIATIVSLAGYGIGTLGGLLLFVEFFQIPSYVNYEPEWDSWQVEVSPMDVEQYSLAGRIGALCIALAFALQFVAVLL